MAQKIISTLLTLQLFVSFGLCGGLCCLTPLKSSGKVEPQKSDEASAAASHCPMHARKAGAAKTHQAAVPSTGRQNDASTALRKTDCCLHRGNVPDAEPSQISAALQTHKHLAFFQSLRWHEGLSGQSPAPSPPKTPLPSSSPPSGFRLSLRI
jgi:hypothetical protein